MVDELGLPELIDAVIKQDHEQRYVSVGLCVKAMICVDWALLIGLYI